MQNGTSRSYTFNILIWVVVFTTITLCQLSLVSARLSFVIFWLRKTHSNDILMKLLNHIHPPPYILPCVICYTMKFSSSLWPKAFLQSSKLIQIQFIAYAVSIYMYYDLWCRVYDNAKANAVMQKAMTVLAIEDKLWKRPLESYRLVIVNCSQQCNFSEKFYLIAPSWIKGT